MIFWFYPKLTFILQIDQDDSVPSIKRPLSYLDAKNDEEFKGLFPSDISDSEDDLIQTKDVKSGKRKLEEEIPEPKKKQEAAKKPAESKKRKTIVEKEESDEDDIGDKVVDFDMSDDEAEKEVEDEGSSDDGENSEDHESIDEGNHCN